MILLPNENELTLSLRREVISGFWHQSTGSGPNLSGTVRIYQIRSEFTRYGPNLSGTVRIYQVRSEFIRYGPNLPDTVRILLDPGWIFESRTSMDRLTPEV